MDGSITRRWAGGGLLAAVVALAGAGPALGQTTTTGSSGVTKVSGGFGLVGQSGTSTAATTTAATTGTTSGTTTGASTDSLDGVIALAGEIAEELGIEFQNPWEELFFVLLVMDFLDQMGGQTGETGASAGGHHRHSGGGSGTSSGSSGTTGSGSTTSSTSGS